jgi:hypothetical protein
LGLVLIVVGLFLAAAAARRIQSSRTPIERRSGASRQDRLASIARELGLLPDRARRLDGRFTGSIDGCSVEVHVQTVAKGTYRAAIRVDAGRIPTDLLLVPRLPSLPAATDLFGPSAWWPRVPETEVEIGGDAFRSRVIVGGEALTVHAVLAEDVRREVFVLLGQYVAWVAGGAVGFLGERLSSEALLALVSDLVELARVLIIEPDNVLSRLHQNVLKDSVANVRTTSMRLMVQHFPDREETRALIAEGHWDSAAPADVPPIDEEHAEQVTALLHLLEVDPPAFREEVARLLRSGQQDDGQVALQALARVDAGSFSLAELEERVLAVLDASTALRCSAALVLGKLGTPRSLGALFAQSSGRNVDREFKECTRTAIAAIRARSGPGERNALSLLETSSPVGALAIRDRAELSISSSPVAPAESDATGSSDGTS